MFEHRNEALLTPAEFAGRMWRSFLVTAAIATVSLAGGMAGYCYFGELAWADGLLNAAMILTGMGPVDKMPTTGGKFFASIYALYSGVAFLSMSAVLTAPIFHRLVHKFLLGEENDGRRGRDGPTHDRSAHERRKRRK
jgi:hypothetical protein